MSPDTKQLAGRNLVDAIVEQMADKKAEHIAAFNVQGLSMMSDWCVICTGNAPVHARAIAQALIQELKHRNGTTPAYFEGVEGGRWAVIDYTDVVAHVMIQEMRDYYEIEDLWRDGARLTDKELGI